MIDQDIRQLFERVERLASALKEKSGSGSEWKYTFPEGDTHTYKFRNIKSPEKIEDDVANLFIWIWNAKDYLKELAKKHGVDPKEVETEVDNNQHWSLCADIANHLKHGILKKSRHGSFPKLDRLRFTIPQHGIGKIVFRKHEVEFTISNPESMELSMAIIAQNGDVIGEAFETLAAGISAIEGMMRKILNGAA